MATRGQGKMANLVNYRLRVTLLDGRQMVGQMLAYDRHMNLVLADVEEFRKVKKRGTKQPAPGSAPAPLVESEEKRALGLVILRGSVIMSSTVESPPPSDPATRLGASAPSGAPSTMTSGPGITKSAGRGMPLSGPALNVGGGFAGFGGNPPVGNPGMGRGFQPPLGFSGGNAPGFGRGFPPGR